MAKKYLDSDGLLYFWQKIANAFVKKDGSKVLSTNDYTTEEKIKLAGIAEGANKTTIIDNLTSTSTTDALSANQGRILDEKIASINTGLEDLGAGDMLKSVYDINGDGIIDNAEKLGGQLPSYYAAASSIPTNNNQLTNGAGYQTAAEVNAAIEAIIGSAPDALNTLEELANALNDDANFAATITTELAKKVNEADLVAITNAEIDTIVAS